jgi:hypothetical protein
VNHYDSKNGWELTKPGWYEVHVYEPNLAKSTKRHAEMVDWIRDNIGKCEHHCRWYQIGNDLHYKFRYERDFIWFKLTWG